MGVCPGRMDEPFCPKDGLPRSVELWCPIRLECVTQVSHLEAAFVRLFPMPPKECFPLRLQELHLDSHLISGFLPPFLSYSWIHINCALPPHPLRVSQGETVGDYMTPLGALLLYQ